MGGSSYIDSVILRDTDSNTAWTAASDATLEERRYLVQNWRADVTTMVNTNGEPVEWYRYTAYGQPTSHPIADVNGDGSVTSADTAAWLDLQGGDSSGSVWLTDDLNRDDVFPSDTADDTFFYAQHVAASGLSSGYDRQSAYGLRKGYAGYEWDDTLTMWHVRHRMLDSKSGKWTKRDPLGYVDGMSDVEYVDGRAIGSTDATGLGTLPWPRPWPTWWPADGDGNPVETCRMYPWVCIQPTREWNPFKGQICNNHLVPIPVCRNTGQCTTLQPGECTSKDIDTDFWYDPVRRQWFKCFDFSICDSQSPCNDGCRPWIPKDGAPLRRWNLPPDQDTNPAVYASCYSSCTASTTACASWAGCMHACLQTSEGVNVPGIGLCPHHETEPVLF
jgi:RHS repeat-associated protein